MPFRPQRVLAIAGLLAAVSACHGGRGVVELEQAVDVTALHIRAPGGTVRVAAGADPAAVQGAHAVSGLGASGRARVSLDEAGVLTIEAPCVPVLPCRLELDVAVPETLPVTVDLGAGTVVVDGVSEADVRLNRGDVTLVDGDTATVRIGQGSLDASLHAAGSLRAVVAAGDVEVAVPPCGWQITAAAAQLQLSGVSIDRAAPGRLDVHAPSGVVLLRGQEDLATL